MPLKDTGRKYKLNGQEIILYPIARLVQELDKVGIPRKAQTLRKWENKGVTPPAFFRFGQKRLYSKEQIEVYCRVAKECDLRKGADVSQTGFSERIWEELEKVNSKYKNTVVS